MSGHKSEKKGSNIICRVSNVNPEMVCRYVERLPKHKMTKEAFQEYMGKKWFQNEHQAPEQWGLYYVDDTHYYPRFDHDITIEEADAYLHHWMRNLIVINPYTRFKTQSDEKLVESIVNQLEKNPNEHDLKTIIRRIINTDEPFVVNEIIANALNNYSEVLRVETIDKDNEKFSVFLLPDYKRIIKTKYTMNKREYFELFENQPMHAEDISKSYRPFITAIKSKPFLLLAGISGTGKSRIVRELARACWDEGSEEYEAQKPRNFEMVQVKPNWHDSSELIGYVSRVSGTPVFVAGDFLKFIAKAWEEPDVPYFLCLDEMNLAPVEQYFAEYLSVVESRKAKENGKIETDPILENKEDWYRILTDELTSDEDVRNRFLQEGICIPQNLIVVGTVNMDETTFSFSRKVLDRAMTIEMNEVDLLGGLDSRHEKIGKLGSAELIGNAVEGVDVYSAHKGVCDTAIAYLQKINDKLEGTPFKIAYRTRNEVLLYVVNNLPYRQDEDLSEDEELKEEFVIARALDEITNMKILSRIEGDETRVSMKFLEDIGKTISEELEEISECSFDVEETDDAYRSVSLAKLDEMKKRLSSGYTSFWS